MSGWIAIPHAALSAVGREGRLAVLDLWERADRCGYTWIRWTERGLAEDWGVDRRVVRDVIGALQDAGLVDVERAAPGSGQSSRLRVHSAVNQDRNQERNQERNQNDRARPPASASPEPETEPAAEPRAYRAPARSDQDQTRPETTADLADAGVQAGAGAASASLEVEEAVAGLIALQERDEPEHGMAQGRDILAIRRGLRAASPADLAALWAWSGIADDPLVAGCRTGGWRRWASLLRQPMDAARIAAARAWDAAGRPAPALPAPRQGRPDRPRASRPAGFPLAQPTPEQARAALVASLLDGQPGWWLRDDDEGTCAAWREAMAAAPHLQLDRREDCPHDLLAPDVRARRERETVGVLLELGGPDEARQSLSGVYGAERVEQLIAELGAA